MIAIRSARASASAWSWVTKTVVTPSSVCSSLEEGPGLQPQPGVEVRQRLVEQEHLRPAGHRPRQGDPLLLTAGKLAGPPLQQAAEREPDADLGGGCGSLSSTHLLDPERVGDVVRDRHVREQGVVLEDHGDDAAHRGASASHHGHRSRCAPTSPSRGPRSCAAASSCRSRTGRAARRTARPRSRGRGVDGADATRVVLDQIGHHDGGHQRLIPPWNRKPYRRLTNRNIARPGGRTAARTSRSATGRPDRPRCRRCTSPRPQATSPASAAG